MLGLFWLKVGCSFVFSSIFSVAVCDVGEIVVQKRECGRSLMTFALLMVAWAMELDLCDQSPAAVTFVLSAGLGGAAELSSVRYAARFW